MKKFTLAFVGAALVAPFAALATTTCTSGGLCNALTTVGTLVSTATPIVVALALLGFFWGLAIYIFNAGDEKKKAEGRSIMIWGILALFVMLSVFGIIGALQSTFQLDNGGTISIPSVQTN